MKVLNQFEIKAIHGGEISNENLLTAGGIVLGATVISLGAHACGHLIANFYGGHVERVLDYYLMSGLIGAAFGVTCAGGYLWGHSSSEQK